MMQTMLIESGSNDASSTEESTPDANALQSNVLNETILRVLD